MSDAPPQEGLQTDSLTRSVIDALPHGVCVYGPDRRVRLVNAAYQRVMAGAEVEVGENHGDILARRIAAGEFGTEMEQTLRNARSAFDMAYEQVRTRPNGTVISVRVVPLPDGGRVAVVTDVTARVAAEAAAERRMATLRAMLDNQPEGVALFDLNSTLIAANALAAQMCGLRVEDMAPGRHILELRGLQIAAGEFGAPEEVRRFTKARGAQPVRDVGRYIRRRPDGTLLEIRTDPTPDGGFIRTYRDVTEDQRARAELQAARDTAEAASRAKTSFLMTMTHELRTPLHAVIGFSEAILEEGKPDRMRAHAEEVLAAGQQLLGLVDGLLEATRIETEAVAMRGTVFDPAPVLHAAAASALKAAGGRLGFTLRIPEMLPPMRGDEARLRQVLDALLSNAIKFTPAGEVTLSAMPRDGGSVITITDTGIGIAPEDIPRAMEAFTQLEGGLTRHYSGSGLGLYLARSLAEAMGITLTLDSTPGEGTTARLTVPPAEENSA
ncbi:PAS domain-containing sensor histidine kinase [Roseomonas chloroacetimidivorans]|uniref:PAS domain-containing sensor histidine kinase n=1 Tax=Roseomonas chloroacetimidivorans TaxID=1766656 RepID=UPI003C75F38D